MYKLTLMNKQELAFESIEKMREYIASQKNINQEQIQIASVPMKDDLNYVCIGTDYYGLLSGTSDVNGSEPPHEEK